MNLWKIFFSIVLLICFSACLESDNVSVNSGNANCGCKESYDPVCGCDDETYLNACLAKCAQMDCYIVGECD